jgi:hypothetical protein
VLVVAVSATTLGMTFGVGGAIPDRLVGTLGSPLGVGVPPRDRVVVYANHNYLVSGPRRDGNVLVLLRGLHEIGVRKVYWDPAAATLEHRDFNGAGLTMLAQFARLSVPTVIEEASILPHHAMLLYLRAPHGSRPCVRFDDGMGVWALIDGPRGAVLYCPGRGVLSSPVPVPQISQGGGAGLP